MNHKLSFVCVISTWDWLGELSNHTKQWLKCTIELVPYSYAGSACHVSTVSVVPKENGTAYCPKSIGRLFSVSTAQEKCLVAVHLEILGSYVLENLY